MKKSFNFINAFLIVFIFLTIGCERTETIAPVTFEPVLTIDKDEAVCTLNTSLVITAAATNSSNTSDTITAKSSDETIATVAVNGVTVTVTAVKNGTAEITIESGSGLSEVCAVKIVTVYAGGMRQSSYMGDRDSGYWKNGDWTTINTFGYFYGALVSSIYEFFEVSGSDVYGGGHAASGSGYSTNSYWKNGTWITCTPPSSATGYSSLSSVAVSGSDVYTSGTYASNISGSNNVYPGYWKNGNWIDLAIPAGFTGGVNPISISVSGDDVYILGSYSYPTIYGYWKNNTWTELSPIVSGSSINYKVNTIIVFGSDVYAAGYCYNSSSVQIPCYWENGERVELDLPYLNNAQVYDIAVSGNDVYAAGYAYNYSSKHAAGYWKNGQWNELKALDERRDSEVKSIVVIGDDVYAGGYCTIYSDTATAEVKVPGYWINGEWYELPFTNEIGYRGGEVQKLVIITE